MVYLGQLFKKETQSSFSQYLNQVRIRKAQQLLLHTEQNIAEIAEEVGFLDMAHFSKVFKKQTGISANTYRNTVLGISDKKE